MIKKNSLILLVIMLLLVGVYLILDQKDSLDFLTKKDEATSTPMPQFVAIERERVESITFARPGEADAVLSKQADGSWSVNIPGGAVEPSDVDYIVENLTGITPTALLSLDMDGSSTGLNEPQYTFTVGLSGGEQIVIKIGKTNPLNNGYYAQVDVNRVVLIPTYDVDNVVTRLELVVSPPTPTPPPTPTNSGS